LPFLSSSSSPPEGDQTRRLLAWYLGIRLAVVVFFLGGTIAYHLKSAAIYPQQGLIKWLWILIALTALQSVASAWFLRRISVFGAFIHAQLAWDLLFVTAVIYFTGGVESTYSFLLILVIVASSFFLPRPRVLIVASAAAILYGSLLDLQFYELLPTLKDIPLATGFKAKDVFYAVFINVGAFLLVALLSGYLAERLRRSEQAREQWEIDFGELERLNQAILANITSGLMIVNPGGRIRSFNQAAVRISGYRLEEVYNRPVAAVFPPFATIDLNHQRGEVRIVTREGRPLILGYSARQVQDPKGKDLGLLIAFQDLTEVKSLEEQLRRADRLAAVGRLASGLAHEIRNPLASISGSVQLLGEDAGFNEENRRLMGIALREVDRLNLLLSDFLSFARPSPVQPEPFDLAALLDELVELMRCDSQVQHVRIEKNYAGPLPVCADRQKLRQALWDLLLNAVQAVPADGVVRIGCPPETCEVYIEDSGPGIDEAMSERIFEPFFTTKERGTGLGLANAYANIEAHQGRLYVEAGALGGARFIIQLPEECRQGS
jgi:two-component system sensor histidine kinase PilS (NtrC family)